MKLSVALCLTMLFAGTAQAQPIPGKDGQVPIGPIQERAHGTGIHSDATGRAATRQPIQGMQRGPSPTLQEEPTSYGLDVHADQPGRMVTPQTKPSSMEPIMPPLGLQNQRGTR